MDTGPARIPHSARSASTGSMRVARRAGTSVEITPAAPMRIETTAIVVGSPG